jgi:hypothetical protein
MTHCLARFQGTPRSLILSIHAKAVRRLLLDGPLHPACAGVHGRCSFCVQFLRRWLDCTAAILTLCCSRCEDGSNLQSCNLWLYYDGQDCYSDFEGGAALNVKIQKNDQFRQGHQPRMGVAKDARLDAVQQMLAVIRLLSLKQRQGCSKRAEPGSHCPVCPPLFPHWSARANAFDLSRQPSSADVSASIVRGLSHVGSDTSLFSGSPGSRPGAAACPQPSRCASRRPSSKCSPAKLKTWQLGATSSCAAPSCSTGRGRRSASDLCPPPPRAGRR